MDSGPRFVPNRILCLQCGRLGDWVPQHHPSVSPFVTWSAAIGLLGLLHARPSPVLGAGDKRKADIQRGT